MLYLSRKKQLSQENKKILETFVKMCDIINVLIKLNKSKKYNIKNGKSLKIIKLHVYEININI